jgi:hypothetical protein
MTTTTDQGTTRAAIVAALEGLDVGDGYTLSAHTEEPGTVAPLDTWPVWESTSPIGLNVSAFQTTWAVYVALGDTERGGLVARGDVVAAAVVVALGMLVGSVTTAEPVQLAYRNSGTRAAVRVLLTV